MSKGQLTLPPNAEPLLPSQNRTAINHHIETNIDSLSGVHSAEAGRLFDRANMNSLELQNRFDVDPVLVADYLRVREDDTLALHPIVCQVVKEEHHDQLLDDLVRTYHDRLIQESGTSRNLEPVPGFPEPALDGLNEGIDLSHRRPEFAINAVEDMDCDGRDIRPATDYPIQVHDIFADLRKKGVVTNLAKSGCEACGHKAGHKLATRLRSEEYTVHGYAGIAASAHPERPLISVQGFDESSWESVDVVDLVLDRAREHSFQSDIKVQKAGILKQ
ncbi:hypothetical protein [Natronosalvus caseinilyticus]|uniref:hypothetical protein n=1 Tax=Natronosalvus caseinilyticus TaxID=2953747 RepID=UPI0028A97EDD|nr:hypothetical protein [Natronosalvus caseinilyticus]